MRSVSARVTVGFVRSRTAGLRRDDRQLPTRRIAAVRRRNPLLNHLEQIGARFGTRGIAAQGNAQCRRQARVARRACIYLQLEFSAASPTEIE